MFETSIDGMIEGVAGRDMVAVVSFPLAYVSRGEGHILIELFTSEPPAQQAVVRTGGRRAVRPAFGLRDARIRVRVEPPGDRP